MLAIGYPFKQWPLSVASYFFRGVVRGIFRYIFPARMFFKFGTKLPTSSVNVSSHGPSDKNRMSFAHQLFLKGKDTIDAGPQKFRPFMFVKRDKIDLARNRSQKLMNSFCILKAIVDV